VEIFRHVDFDFDHFVTKFLSHHNVTREVTFNQDLMPCSFLMNYYPPIFEFDAAFEHCFSAILPPLTTMPAEADVPI